MMIFVRKNHKSSVSQPLVGVKMRAWAFLNVEFHGKPISGVFETTGNRLELTILKILYFFEKNSRSVKNLQLFMQNYKFS